MHPRKLLLVLMFISLIRAHYSIRVDTTIGATQKSESAEEAAAAAAQLQPKAEALTLLIQKRVPLRPVKVIERSDDVVVIHTKNRVKRKQISRGRRRPSNQFRSKIRPSGSRPSSSTSNFGGFKDFSLNDLRFPSFPTKPPRASNKLKFGSSKQRPSYDYNAQPVRRPPRPSQVVQTISTVYGPPSTSFNNQIDTQYGVPLTLQQAQNNIPSFSIEPIQTNFFASGGSGGGNSNNNNNNYNNHNNNNNNNHNHNNFGGNSNNNNFAAPNEISRYPTSQSISNFPLSDGSSFNVPKTSYGEPVRSASSPSTSSYQFNSIIGNQQPSQNNRNHNNNNPNNNNNNNNNHANNGNTFPKLPNRYDTNEFSTPTRNNPLNLNNYDFGNLDAISESKNVLSSVPSSGGSNQFNKNRFNKFNNFDYGFGTNYNDEEEDEDDEEENYEFAYTTKRPRFSILTTTSTTTPIPTTTKRSRKNVFGKRKRPAKIAQNHNLDTDDLRDAFSESSNNDFHEVSLNSEDFLNFDSQRNVKKALGNNPIHEIHSTLKHARKNPALRQALGDDFQILSVEKSLEQNPNNFGGINFQRRGDEERNINNEYREFSVGGDINFSGAQAPNMWNGDMNSFPRNHRFS